VAEKSSFFNSVDGDRKYQASDYAEYFNSLITNGVFPNPSTNLQVLSNNDMTVTLSAGRAWINGYIYINDSDLIAPVEVADGVLKRIDRVVIRFDTIGRAIYADIKKGVFASNPVAPALQRDADLYELGIADISIVNGATSITQANITDLRLNTDLCGYVNSLIQADTTAIFNQYEDWFTSQSNTYNTNMIANETQFQTDFDTWFNAMKDQLTTDAAGNLQTQINTLAGTGWTTETVKGNADAIVTTNTNVTNLDASVTSQLADMMTQDPAITDDISKSYFVGKHWVNTLTGEEWICTDNTENNAIWRSIKYDKTIQPTELYGVKIDTTNSNPLSALTYTDDAVGFTPALGNNGSFNAGSWADKFPFNLIKPCLYLNGAVNYYLNPNNYAQKVDGVTASDITSGTDGDVMIEFPKIYWKFETIGTDLYIRYSDAQIDDSYKCLGHLRGTAEKDKCYISAYMGYDLSSKLRSLSGKTPTATQTIGTFRTLAKANGAGYDQMAFNQLTMLQVLYTVMFKNRDSQTALGRGYVDGNSASIATGGANSKGMFYGETTGKQQNKFCGIEDFYGNLLYWIDGFFSSSAWHILTANQNFNDTGSGYVDNGQGATANLGGYISGVQGTTETGFVIKATTGSATTHYSDYGSLNDSCLPSFGGYYSDTDNAGAFLLRANYSVAYSTAIIGSRLMSL